MKKSPRKVKVTLKDALNGEGRLGDGAERQTSLKAPSGENQFRPWTTAEEVDDLLLSDQGTNVVTPLKSVATRSGASPRKAEIEVCEEKLPRQILSPRQIVINGAVSSSSTELPQNYQFYSPSGKYRARAIASKSFDGAEPWIKVKGKSAPILPVIHRNLEDMQLLGLKDDMFSLQGLDLNETRASERTCSPKSSRRQLNVDPELPISTQKPSVLMTELQHVSIKNHEMQSPNSTMNSKSPNSHSTYGALGDILCSGATDEFQEKGSGNNFRVPRKLRDPSTSKRNNQMGRDPFIVCKDLWIPNQDSSVSLPDLKMMNQAPESTETHHHNESNDETHFSSAPSSGMPYFLIEFDKNSSSLHASIVSAHSRTKLWRHDMQSVQNCLCPNPNVIPTSGGQNTIEQCAKDLRLLQMLPPNHCVGFLDRINRHCRSFSGRGGSDIRKASVGGTNEFFKRSLFPDHIAQIPEVEASSPRTLRESLRLKQANQRTGWKPLDAASNETFHRLGLSPFQVPCVLRESPSVGQHQHSYVTSFQMPYVLKESVATEEEIHEHISEISKTAAVDDVSVSALRTEDPIGLPAADSRFCGPIIQDSTDALPLMTPFGPPDHESEAVKPKIPYSENLGLVGGFENNPASVPWHPGPSGLERSLHGITDPAFRVSDDSLEEKSTVRATNCDSSEDRAKAAVMLLLNLEQEFRNERKAQHVNFGAPVIAQIAKRTNDSKNSKVGQEPFGEARESAKSKSVSPVLRQERTRKQNESSIPEGKVSPTLAARSKPVKKLGQNLSSCIETTSPISNIKRDDHRQFPSHFPQADILQYSNVNKESPLSPSKGRGADCTTTETSVEESLVDRVSSIQTGQPAQINPAPTADSAPAKKDQRDAHHISSTSARSSGRVAPRLGSIPRESVTNLRCSILMIPAETADVSTSRIESSGLADLQVSNSGSLNGVTSGLSSMEKHPKLPLKLPRAAAGAILTSEGQPSRNLTSAESGGGEGAFTSRAHMVLTYHPPIVTVHDSGASTYRTFEESLNLKQAYSRRGWKGKNLADGVPKREHVSRVDKASPFTVSGDKVEMATSKNTVSSPVAANSSQALSKPAQKSHPVEEPLRARLCELEQQIEQLGKDRKAALEAKDYRAAQRIMFSTTLLDAKRIQAVELQELLNQYRRLHTGGRFLEGAQLLLQVQDNDCYKALMSSSDSKVAE